MPHNNFINFVLGVVLSTLSPVVFALNIAVSIPPLAGMISPLLDEHDQLEVILKPGQSPHGFHMTPKDHLLLKQADMVVVVASPVDQWMSEAIPDRAIKIELSQLSDIERLPKRQQSQWQQHGHDHHDHHSPQGGHDHDDQVEHEKDDHDKHEASTHYDGHLWMSHHNAKRLIEEVSFQLQQLDPARKPLLQARTTTYLHTLDQAFHEAKQTLSPFSSKAFVVLHDAFQYLEHQFELKGVGALRLNPDIAPSIHHLMALHQTMKQQQVVCVFKEPQFPIKNIQLLLNKQDIRLGELDPMGTYWAKGQSYLPYEQMLHQTTQAMKECLGG